MEAEKHYSELEIIARARTALAPLTCDPIWSRDHDQLGFLVRDEKTRRGIRFSPIKVDMLEQDAQLGKVLSGIRKQLMTKGFSLTE